MDTTQFLYFSFSFFFNLLLSGDTLSFVETRRKNTYIKGIISHYRWISKHGKNKKYFWCQKSFFLVEEREILTQVQEPQSRGFCSWFEFPCDRCTSQDIRYHSHVSSSVPKPLPSATYSVFACSPSLLYALASPSANSCSPCLSKRKYITLYRKIQQTRSQREVNQICSSFTYVWSTMNILIS